MNLTGISFFPFTTLPITVLYSQGEFVFPSGCCPENEQNSFLQYLVHVNPHSGHLFLQHWKDDDFFHCLLSRFLVLETPKTSHQDTPLEMF